MKELNYLNKYFYKYRTKFLLGLGFIILSKVFATVPAVIVRWAINYVTESYNRTSTEGIEKIFFQTDNFTYNIAMAGLAIIGLAILSGLFLYFQRQTIIGTSRLIEFDLKNEIYEHYQTLPLSFYRKNNTGDLLARVSEDVSNVRMYLGPAVMYILDLIVLFAVTVPIMFFANAKLTLYVLLPLPVLALSIFLIENLIVKKSLAIQKELSALSTYSQESFSGIRVTKSFVREDKISQGFAEASEVYKAKSLELARVNAFFFPVILALIGLSTIMVLYVGGNELIEGRLHYGNIPEFFLYINRLTWPVASLGWTTSLVQKAEASQGRINEFLKTKTDIISQKNFSKNLQGEVEFENVSLVYPDTGITALNGVSFKVKAGESLAIIGGTGSGKSSIANLMVRLYDSTHGSIKIDNVPIRDYDIQSLRAQCGYVPQDVFLFSDSIRNNIAFGSLFIGENQVIQAAKDADLYQNIIEFPEKFDTILGERGITLSGGQKQRLSIARAISRSPKILILDDCLSAVDTKTENTILNNLKKIMKDRTTIIISHRASSVKLADQIIVLENGEVAEKGNHESLMKLNGIYKTLYTKQLEEESKV
ncbi:putative multidrug resistance ABC transporter ATP-binding/permease protein YheI [Sporocytophaga myxococcoides]|uniref:Putative multidrug resistance ABC transporter ATP-binding/permease protein YheI n=1 Tax=Sporocytophaga myxococcoides TaxID=153721 RepID=A0A098LL95_9BACT|nr:ABC transporter ATP-binding protein [Sporocytophaga myxococcoides]GAL86898.1 putative multidrug resistance ABC transporter ATP-binding/permease protein YheI [Sporocytophaga myxococcoides]